MKNCPITSVAVAVILALLLFAVFHRGQSFRPHDLLPPAPEIDEIYPRPVDIPPRTIRPLTELLAEYEAATKQLSPSAHAALQPGLSEIALDELERKYSIVLSSDMRTLYLWKNGTGSFLDVFPYRRFVPLDEALDARAQFRNAGRGKPAEVRALYDDWLSHRYSWVGLIQDGGGDGYYYDPERRSEVSSFFYTRHDDVGYMFYPAIGNYIEELLEHHRVKRLSATETGITLDVDWTYDEEKSFGNRFGCWVR